MAGLWEFPGGKREPGERIEQCLVRELREELGIEVALGQLFEEVTHDYPEKTVHLKFFLCRLAKGKPRASRAPSAAPRTNGPRERAWPSAISLRPMNDCLSA